MSSLAIWALTAFLFACGLAMVALRRQLLAMLMGLELMISSVNLALVYYASRYADGETLAAVLLIIAVAAAEAVVGLSLILKVYRAGLEVESEALAELKG
jgi:NADH-quinone oxidoreductase subunit K